MRENQFLNKKLTCIKTGCKAKIVNYYESHEVSYVKINIMMQFENSDFHVLKTCRTDEIESQFNYS